ncbi:TetR family transcriptional regulator [Nocardia terpenica]|uniref:TetR/AcrR family transcriptional regulator n=1 Tax=Nocardia terpenica TaxID=455432 RepID=UPI001895FB95|nr:TetR family transcriptional regulator [Nocardia terpenica]MBF6060855.1 TetR family transcriptional regulator [Nocardia terpenica]MBF6104115.1 TetR family transcriptional regulator [Nocardia terpenica]MBF6111511.1 TetR family transcriptional regulator [Nocardia terpenica]MBF6118336.1 TetR family transcriptional regulator [Nocardia terpenica]MBF6155658.1 TetR family transcriptional regulator [Nocardia terpenica]
MFKRAAVPEGSPEDLSTRARIRDAAIQVFGEQGLGVGVRAIASAAGVSPGLVNHHFGSKDGLREACDEHVRGLIRQAKLDSVQHPSSQGLLQSLAEAEDFAPYLAYLMRNFQAGGALTSVFFEHMVSDVETYLTAGIEAGTIRPQRDIKATARFMAYQNGGGFLLFLQMYSDSHEGPTDYRKAIRAYMDQMLLPALDIFTHGLLTDSMLLDTLLDER